MKILLPGDKIKVKYFALPHGKVAEGVYIVTSVTKTTAKITNNHGKQYKINRVVKKGRINQVPRDRRPYPMDWVR